VNVWTDIALGNLTRQRGAPLDMDLETGAIKPMELFQCKGPCGEEKPATEFYVKHDKRYDKVFRQSTCKVCICARDRKKKNRFPPITTRNLILVVLDRPMSIREIGEAAGRSRRPTDAAIAMLMQEGLVKRAGFGSRCTNSRVPLYERA
jgi:hypothetical protein